MWNRLKRVFERSPREPAFVATYNDDKAMLMAYQAAAATTDRLVSLINSGSDAIRCVKPRLKDPALSEKLGENRFVFLWLGNVQIQRDGSVD
jgi:hypothetical protein